MILILLKNCPAEAQLQYLNAYQITDRLLAASKKSIVLKCKFFSVRTSLNIPFQIKANVTIQIFSDNVFFYHGNKEQLHNQITYSIHKTYTSYYLQNKKKHLIICKNFVTEQNKILLKCFALPLLFILMLVNTIFITMKLSLIFFYFVLQAATLQSVNTVNN